MLICSSAYDQCLDNEMLGSRICKRQERSRSLSQSCIAGAAIAGGATVIIGAWLSWFSLFAGLQPYRGVDVLNGRLLTVGGIGSVLAGLWFIRSVNQLLRWGIGLLGFAMLAFSSWSLFQLLILYRELSADKMMVATLGPGLIVIAVGSLIVFSTLFFGDG